MYIFVIFVYIVSFQTSFPTKTENTFTALNVFLFFFLLVMFVNF